MEIKIVGDHKFCNSPDYKYIFNMKNGRFDRWGLTAKVDPQFAPMPEILDCEITTICENNCCFCYKSNTSIGKNMSLENFIKILNKINKYGQLTQVAFGVDAKNESNPDVYQMMKYCRECKVIPNITVAKISDFTAEQLTKYCGAVAVSRYANKNDCYDSVKKLIDRGMKQINIHSMISLENFDQTLETINDIKTDKRLEKLNAIVMLSLKKKGRGIDFHCLDYNKFEILVNKCNELQINYGFDSCGSSKYLKYIENHPEYKHYEQYVEPCESSCFSSYVNVDGIYYPCSFCENIENGINIFNCNDFENDIWNNEITKNFRTKLLNNNRNCPIFKV